MSFGETIRSKWNPKSERHVIGNCAFDAIGSVLAASDTIETRRAALVGDLHLSEKGKAAELAKVAAAQAKTVEAARRTLAMGRDALRGQRAALIPKPADANNVRGMMLRQETRGILRQKTFSELLALFGAEGTAREIYEAFFEAPAGIMNVSEAQRDQLMQTTVERIGGPALEAIAEQSEALDLLAATTGRVCDVLVETANIRPQDYAEWIGKVAPVGDLTIANEKAAFESEVNRPTEEITPLVARSQIVQQLLENGIA